MPNLDGVSATCRIRQFDQQTPIISMTSNVQRDDCMTYLANGMNDILPKPFSRDSLLAMLDRYCSHLRDRVKYGGSQMQLYKPLCNNINFKSFSYSMAGTSSSDSNGNRTTVTGRSMCREEADPDSSADVKDRKKPRIWDCAKSSIGQDGLP
jgi:DNA-binding response OmpR family regulator